MNDVYVLDACALIALLNNELGTEIVENILQESILGNVSVVMNKINLLEVYYDLYRKYGKETADDLFAIPREFSICIRSEISDEVFIEAGRLKASYRISIADSIALAEASVSGGSLMTSDHHEFDVLERSERISFHWIR